MNEEMVNPSASSAYIGWRLVAFTAVWIPLQIIAVALRFYVRRLLVGTKHTFEDTLVLLSLVLQIILSAVEVASVPHAGVGYHLAYLKRHDPGKIITWFKYLLVAQVTYAFASVIPKLAVLVLYRTVFAVRTARIIIWILIAVLVGQIISNTIVVLAACRPFEANYKPGLPGATCIDKERFFTWATFPNIVTDVIILVLPLPIVWGLHNTRRIKIGLTFTFFVGSSGLVTSIMRFNAFVRTNSFKDTTWDAVELLIWTALEPGIYLISACLLSYRPLLERVTTLFPKGSRKESSTRGRSRSAGYGKSRSGTGSLPLTQLSTRGKGFKELDEETGSSGTGSLAFASTGPAGITPTQNGLITVTTDIENEWADRR